MDAAMTMIYSACWACRVRFWYNPEVVASIPVDRADRPVDDVRTAYRTAPICPDCMGLVIRERLGIDTPQDRTHLPADSPPVGVPRPAYMVLNGMILRRTWENEPTGRLCPMAGLPNTIQPNPAPEPHLAWIYDDGRAVCEPWCWCEIEKKKRKEQRRING
jgi:hypothetical protein